MTATHARRSWLWFTAAFAITMIGFWPSFFRRLGETGAGHMVHGISATLWMLLPIVQALLISRRSTQWHRKIGLVSVPLAPIVIVSGVYIVHVMLEAERITRHLRLKFAFLDLTAMLVFAVFYVLAMHAAYTRRFRAHARYITCTVLIALEPALERFLVYCVPGIDDFDRGLLIALLSMEAIALTLLVRDRRSGRLEPCYLAMCVFFAGMLVLLEPVTESRSFQAFAAWFAAL